MQSPPQQKTEKTARILSSVIASICLTVLMFASNTIILSSLGRTGIYAFALCMNLLLIYNLFLGGDGVGKLPCDANIPVGVMPQWDYSL